MELTEISQYKNRSVSGYMLNAGFSSENQHILTLINEKIKAKFGDVILEQPSNALHITLMDWVTPLVTYDRGWDELFEEVFPLNNEILSKQLESVPPFKISFDTIRVSPAAIFIQGHDDGQFQQIREDFLQETDLLPGTKQPPTIVHCTIARFDKEVDINPIRDFVETLTVQFEQRIEKFRLVHEIQMPMLAYDVIKEYTLAEDSNRVLLS